MTKPTEVTLHLGLIVDMLCQVLVGCGFWDNSIRCYGVEDGRLLQTLRLHKDIVTCVAPASNGATLVSGELLWHDLNR